MIDKRTYMLEACRAEAAREVSWLILVFSETQEDSDDWRKDPYPYRLVKREDQCFYVDPNNVDRLVPIADTKGNGPLIRSREPLELRPGDAANVTEPVVTTYENLVANYIMLIYAMGNKIPFQTGRLSAKGLEKLVKARIESDPKEGEPVDPNKIYVSEVIKFADGCAHWLHFTQLRIPGETERSVQTHPNMNALRDKLYEEHKHELHDPVVIAKINEQLKALDKEWLSGDPALGLWINEKKDFDVVRRKLFYHMGHESGFGTGNQANPIKNSLNEGWDMDRFDQYNNSSRAGTYGRGVQTALGGEWVSWLIRISANISIALDDCGSKIGDRVLITKDNCRTFEGYYYLNRNAEPILYDIGKAEQYIGKRVIFRSPQFCKGSKTDYCKVCMGTELSIHKEGASMAISNIGSRIMNMFMKLMHGRSLSTATYDIFDEMT